MGGRGVPINGEVGGGNKRGEGLLKNGDYIGQRYRITPQRVRKFSEN